MEACSGTPPRAPVSTRLSGTVVDNQVVGAPISDRAVTGGVPLLGSKTCFLLFLFLEHFLSHGIYTERCTGWQTAGTARLVGRTCDRRSWRGRRPAGIKVGRFAFQLCRLQVRTFIEFNSHPSHKQTFFDLNFYKIVIKL